MAPNRKFDSVVEAGQYPVVAVEDMNETPNRSLQTGIEVLRYPDVLRLPIECNPTAAEPTDNFLRVVARRTVIDYFDLHDFRPRALGKDTAKGCRQKPRTIVGRNHYRPNGMG